MDSSTQSPSAQSSTQAAAAGVARRRLIRAGLSAAPVLTALKANSVLAGGSDHSCIRPSSFSSLKPANFTVSKGRTVRTDYECKSHGYWKKKTSGLPVDFKKKTKFISGTTGFIANPNGKYSEMSLQDVLDNGGNVANAALARHVVAAFLTATAFGNNPQHVLLTKSECAAIWNGQGAWSPFPGANWQLVDTMSYFEKIYGPSFL